jgi:O-antigen/teichoic acid export membrane protein
MLLLRLPLSFLLAFFFHAFGIAASWGIAVAVAFVISILLFVPKVQDRYKPATKLNLGIIGNMWRYSTGSYLALLSASAPALVLPIMVVNLLGAEQSAYFCMDWMIASLLFSIPGAISQSLFAEGSHFEDELRSNVGKSLKLNFYLLIPAVILILLLGKWLLLLLGESYSINGLLLLRILCVSSVFIGINRVYFSTLRVEDRIRELTLVYAFQATVLLVSSYFVMPAAGIAGIGYVWLTSQGIVSIYAALVMKSRYMV